MIVNLYLNSIKVNDPLNLSELSIQLLYDRDNTSQQIEDQPRKTASVTRWEFGLGDKLDSRDGARIIDDWVFTQNLVTEGIPLYIEIEDEGVTDIVFDGYLDPQTASYECDRISIDAVEVMQVDQFNDVADSSTYKTMFDNGEFDRTKFVSIPYIISTIPNSFEAMLSIISMFTLLFVFTSQLQELIELLAGSLNPLQFMDIIKLVLRGIYVSTQFILLVVIIKQIANLLIQPVKYFESMYTRDLLEIGANHFGYTFYSSIYDESSVYYNEVIIPEKYSHNVNSDKDDVLGFLSPDNPETFGYYNGTFGDIIRILKVKFNAKLFFINGQLRLERRDFKIGSAQYKLNPVDEKDFRINANELIANTVIAFTLDPNDKNTSQRYFGTLTQAIQEADTVINSDYVILKGFQERRISWARGNRKNELTLIERIIKGFAVAIDPIANGIVTVFNGLMSVFETFFDVIDTVLSILSLVGINITVQDIIDTFNDFLDSLNVPRSVPILLSGGAPVIIFLSLNIDTDNLPRLEWVNIGDAIRERIGMLLVENDFITIPKNVIIKEDAEPSETEVSEDDETYENSQYLTLNFHAIDSFVPTTERPNANQYKIFDIEIDKFCFTDYLNVKNNSFIFDYNDKEAELISLDWNVYKKTAKIEYKLNELYTNNVKARLVTLDGK